MTPVRYLKALQALEASVRLGSFRSAGAELGVTAAAVGQQVRILETALGRQLLVRKANGCAPSDTARQAAASLASGFDELRNGLAIMTHGDRQRRVFVTVTPSIAEWWLAPRLAGFLSGHPQIDLRIDSTPYVLYEAGGEFDFALRYNQPGITGSDETFLFHETLIPVCTPDLAARLEPSDQPDCLESVPLIHVDRSTDDPEWLHWEEWGEKFGYGIPKKRSGQLQFAFTTLALRSVYDGHGLHLAQLSNTLPGLISGRLVAPFGVSKCVQPSYQYSLANLGAGKSTALQRAFRAWIVSEAEKTQSDMNQYLAANS